MICPNCKSNLEGGLIYETFLALHGDPEKARMDAAMYGATETTGRWGREKSVYDVDLDRTVGWSCPDCNHEWERS